MYESENIDDGVVVVDEGDGSPVCITCLKPVDRGEYYCPYCGEAVGQLTPYLPFVNIRWYVNTWGKIWRQVWSRDVSIPGRLLSFIMIVFYVPYMLIGLLFIRKNKESTEGEKLNIQ